MIGKSLSRASGMAAGKSAKDGMLARLKKRSSSSSSSTAGAGKLVPVCAYNQPLTPEDAIMTPAGGFVDRRWLLDSGGGQPCPAAAAPEAKTKSSRRLWRTVLKRCKRFGGGRKAAFSAPAPPSQPAQPTPRCVLERVASRDWTEAAAGSTGALLVAEDETTAACSRRRKCSYHSELKASKVGVESVEWGKMHAKAYGISRLTGLS